MSEWSATQYLPVGAVVAKRRDMPSELWVKQSEAEERIAELEVEITEWQLYSEAVAEICSEKVFSKIEAEFELRKKVARGES